MSKNLRKLTIFLKRAETSVVLIVFYGVLCKFRAYTVTVSYRCST